MTTAKAKAPPSTWAAWENNGRVLLLSFYGLAHADPLTLVVTDALEHGLSPESRKALIDGAARLNARGLQLSHYFYVGSVEEAARCDGIARVVEVIAGGSETNRRAAVVAVLALALATPAGVLAATLAGVPSLRDDIRKLATGDVAAVGADIADGLAPDRLSTVRTLRTSLRASLAGVTPTPPPLPTKRSELTAERLGITAPADRRELGKLLTAPEGSFVVVGSQAAGRIRQKAELLGWTVEDGKSLGGVGKGYRITRIAAS